MTSSPPPPPPEFDKLFGDIVNALGSSGKKKQQIPFDADTVSYALGRGVSYTVTTALLISALHQTDSRRLKRALRVAIGVNLIVAGTLGALKSKELSDAKAVKQAKLTRKRGTAAETAEAARDL